MPRVHRHNIHEGGASLISVDNASLGFALQDLAEYTARHEKNREIDIGKGLSLPNIPFLRKRTQSTVGITTVSGLHAASERKSCIMLHMEGGHVDMELHPLMRKRYNHKNVESCIGFASWQIVEVS
jgi:hypothetical protein